MKKILTSHLGQIRAPWNRQVFIIAHIVIGLLLHIHYFIRPRVHVVEAARKMRLLIQIISHLETEYCKPLNAQVHATVTLVHSLHLTICLDE